MVPVQTPFGCFYLWTSVCVPRFSYLGCHNGCICMKSLAGMGPCIQPTVRTVPDHSHVPSSLASGMWSDGSSLDVACSIRRTEKEPFRRPLRHTRHAIHQARFTPVQGEISSFLLVVRLRQVNGCTRQSAYQGGQRCSLRSLRWPCTKRISRSNIAKRTMVVSMSNHANNKERRQKRVRH